MKTVLVCLLFLTLTLNSYADDIVALESNNPPLTDDLAGINECQIAEPSTDGTVFTSFFYREKPNGQGSEVYAIVTADAKPIKALI